MRLSFLAGPVMGLALFLVSAGGALAQGSGSLGQISGFLPDSGQDGVWEVQNSGSQFTISNRQDDGAISYYWVDLAAESAGRRVIEADVALEPGGQQSFGGILYGFDPDTRHYFVYALNAAGGVSLFRRDEGGFREMIGTEIDAVRPGVNRLRIEEQGGNIQMYVNGTRVSGIGASGIGRGALGLAAGGTGRVTWSAFSVAGDGAGRLSPPPIGTADRAEAAPVQPQGQQPGLAQQTQTQTQPPGFGQQLGGTTQAATQAAAQGDFARFTPTEIVDSTGPLGQMVAYRVLAPNGWKTVGGVQWGSDAACFNGGRLVWGVGTEDERYGLALLPPISWSVTNFGGRQTGCLQLDIQDAGQALQAFFDTVGEQMGTFRIVEVTRPPEVQQYAQQLGAMNAMGGMPGMRSYADGVLARVESSVDGKDSESYMIVLSMHFEISQEGVGGPMISRFGNVPFMLAVSTPPGELEQGHPAFETVMSSLQVDPQWDAAHRAWWRRKLEAGRPTGGGASSSLGGTTGGGGISDDSHSQAIQGIWDTHEFQDDEGNTYTGSTQFETAWKLDNGEVVFTNDQFFNPVEQTGQFGSRLRSVR